MIGSQVATEELKYQNCDSHETNYLGITPILYIWTAGVIVAFFGFDFKFVSAYVRCLCEIERKMKTVLLNIWFRIS